MGFLSFNVSYFLLPPKHVRLPGEAVSSPPASPTKAEKVRRATSMRFPARDNTLSARAGRSFRSLVGRKGSIPPALQKGKAREQRPMSEAYSSDSVTVV
ncbi:hypothetical protein D9619_006273 [Psilocybe cf. subviscida]|uniref:Uncharacterized protein n=1 Tax=Psilocybe cf. subviscida TaxID=2480587 RepID=A0A8H5EY04_9AGAR|nr:hypothetical protein D9619_006273 [Psilocybe cf. subviscida]